MFKGERIKLRKLAETDIETYHSWRNNEEVMRYTNPSLDKYTFSETQEFVEKITQSPTSKSYMIELIQSRKPLGITSLINIDYKNRNAECIIDIGEHEYWGNGYGKEALQLLIKYSFVELNLHKVYLRVFSFNDRAISLYEKMGFRIEGEQIDQLFRDGEWHNVVLMAIFQKDFFAAKS
ncbi:acetyltransferase [Halobacillus andaensis]|uniref:Acetyltransferase n=1 Tax=Halobacillus andaensis TaxID=1176239 RepID=A0A917B1S5_HALAA|nr:GNAT family protein [Halobacillus andaensis]MBP2003858.1 RimJ/RimL family protein N-acetyltransferase [Halobacillus andaensis]GGF13789.1 acetyltransferase [Halobacillus andaensis]